MPKINQSELSEYLEDREPRARVRKMKRQLQDASKERQRQPVQQEER